jgi:hypothetical protein
MIHELPRDCLHQAVLRRSVGRVMELEQENARLREFNRQLCERVFAAHEWFAKNAERKEPSTSKE